MRLNLVILDFGLRRHGKEWAMRRIGTKAHVGTDAEFCLEHTGTSTVANASAIARALAIVRAQTTPRPTVMRASYVRSRAKRLISGKPAGA